MELHICKCDNQEMSIRVYTGPFFNGEPEWPRVSKNEYHIKCMTCGDKWVGKDPVRQLVEEKGYKVVPFSFVTEKKGDWEQLELDLH